MTPARFGDRLDATTYADDPRTGVFADDPDGGVWTPERLFERLTNIGRGYSLHTLSRVGGSERVSLNRLEAENLLDELRFVAERVNDDLLLSHVQEVERFVAETVGRPGEVAIYIEGH